MNLLATIRQRQAPWTPRVLGLFVVVWLNMALQPCAMAFGDLNDNGCLHCPPAHSGQHSSQSTHEVDHSDLGASPWETNELQCAFVDDSGYDGSVVTVKVKDAQGDVPVGIAPRITAGSLENSWSALPDINDSLYLPGSPPPLNVLYGVYLI